MSISPSPLNILELLFEPEPENRTDDRDGADDPNANANREHVLTSRTSSGMTILD